MSLGACFARKPDSVCCGCNMGCGQLDPLDDSSIPQYQKWKKIKNVRLHNAQWAGFITTCILLICAVHVTRLREIIWYGFAFWQWLALAFVAGAGRLISGWGVKVSSHTLTFAVTSLFHDRYACIITT